MRTDLEPQVGPAYPCRAPGCSAPTSERKPYCSDHVLSHLPLAQKLHAEVEARELEEARVAREGRAAVDLEGSRAIELLELLEAEGAAELDELSKLCGLTTDALRAYVHALVRAGRVSERMERFPRRRRSRDAIKWVERLVVEINGMGRGVLAARRAREEVAEVGAKKGWDEETRRAIAARLEAGEKPRALAREFKCAPISITRVGEKWGSAAPARPAPKKTGPKRFEIDPEKLREWREAGRSASSIAEELGTTKNTVLRRCRELGIEARATVEPALTDEQRAEVRRAFLAGEASQHELATQYGVAQTTISRACRGGRAAAPVAVANGNGAPVLVAGPANPSPPPQGHPHLAPHAAAEQPSGGAPRGDRERLRVGDRLARRRRGRARRAGLRRPLARAHAGHHRVVGERVA